MYTVCNCKNNRVLCYPAVARPLWTDSAFTINVEMEVQ